VCRHLLALHPSTSYLTLGILPGRNSSIYIRRIT
jgi:hypothetical protein